MERGINSGSGRYHLVNRSFGRIWVVNSDGILAGYMILTFNYDLEFGGLQGSVTDLFVAPRFRAQRRGIAAMHCTDRIADVPPTSKTPTQLVVSFIEK